MGVKGPAAVPIFGYKGIASPKGVKGPAEVPIFGYKAIDSPDGDQGNDTE